MTRLSALLSLGVCFTVCFQAMLAADQSKVIESFHVKSDIRFRLATTQIESVVRNTADAAQEILFDVTLPKEAFITSFSMLVDGKVYTGEVKEKTEAKQTYTAAVEIGETAGHIKQAARHANVFEVSVNVANGSAATFTLTYQEMLRRKLGAYQHEIHISPGQAVKDFFIQVFIQENTPLRFVKSPALQTGSLLTNKIYTDENITIVDRPSPKTAYIAYRPTLTDQGDGGLAARFIVEYDVEHSASGEVLVVDGYFVHFFAPDVPPMPKDIVFVLDVLGSMIGQKIQQLKDAMLVVLGDLQPDDRFNIITFSSSVEKWSREFVRATPETIERARTFVKSIHAQGGTNINSALVTGALELKGIKDQQRAGIIFFLTDGEPTQGIVDPSIIAENILETNGNTSAIFGLAFGTSADYELLTTISSQNSGFARKIYADAALQVASLYNEISAVSMKHLSFEYLPSSVDEYTLTKKTFPVVLTGTEVIVCGRMAPNADVFQMEVTGVQKSGPVNVVMEVGNVTELVIDADETANNFFTIPRDFSGIVEKMWAYITTKQYLKDKEIYASDKTKVEELKTKIIQTAIKYKFVTPLTSMVVTKPESPETAVESAFEDADFLPQARQQSSGVMAYPMLSSHRSSGVMAYPMLSRHRSSGVMAYPMLSRHRRSRHRSSGVMAYPMLSRHRSSGVMAYPMLSRHRSSGVMAYPMLSRHRSSGSMDMMSTFSSMQGSRGFHPSTHHQVSPDMHHGRRNIDRSRVAIKKTKPRVIASSRPSMTIMSSSTAALGLLAVITLNTGNLSVCLAPKKIKEGTYALVRTPIGSSINIETACGGKSCKDFMMKRLLFENNGSKAEVSFDKNTGYRFFTESYFNVTRTTLETVKVTDRLMEIEVTITKIPKNGRYYYYSLDITLSPLKGYNGFIGNILNMKRKQLEKWQKKRVPALCKDKSTSISRRVNNKMLARYKTAS